MKIELLAKLLATTILSATLATPALAADNAPPAANEPGISDIIVTARRVEERLQDVPISITVLSQEAISQRNITNAGDLGTYVPSLSTNANFGPEKSSFAIRGFNQEGRTAPTVAVYFADVVAPRANSGTTVGNGAGVGAFFDLQNVQVLKGPQGTLFGRNTTGGAILLVPTKPTNRLEGYIEGTLGNYNERRLQGVLNVPLSDTIRVRGAVDWNKQDGYLRNRSGIGPSALGNTNYIAARLSVVADITPDIENYTIARYSKSDTFGNIPKIVAGGPFPGFPLLPGLAQTFGPLGSMQVARATARGDDFWDVDNTLPNPREMQKTWQVINTTTWKASDNLTVKNIVSYAEFHAVTAFNLFGTDFQYAANMFGFPHPAGTFPVIVIGTGPTGEYASNSTFTEELQFQGVAANGRLNWQVGGYLEVSKPLDWSTNLTQLFMTCTDALTYQCTNNIFGFGNLSSANTKDTFNNKGLYAQATYKLSDQFSVTGGIRYTMDRIRNQTRNINIAIPTPGNPVFTCQNVVVFPGKTASGPVGAECDNVIKIESKRPTWLIDLEYKPNQDVLLYAKYSRGYRQGTIIPSNLLLETTGPETVDTFEAGAKASFHGAVPGYFNIAAFYNDFRDQQLAANAVVAPAYINTIAPSQAIINAGKSRMWGIEIDASVRPFEGFKLDASYAYLNTKLISINPPVPPIFFSQLVASATVGSVLAQSPKNRISLTATYTLPLDEKVGKISIGGSFTHTDANQVQDQQFSPTQYMVQAQDLVNFNLDWKSVGGMPVDLSFFMTNVTNQKRIVYPLAIYTFAGVDGGYLNLPRMWGFRLRYSFGK